MARQTNVEHYTDAIRDIYDTVQGAGTTRADQAEALEAIADLCTDAIPDLGESESSDDENDDD